jgi:hypothetical protein
MRVENEKAAASGSSGEGIIEQCALAVNPANLAKFLPAFVYAPRIIRA